MARVELSKEAKKYEKMVCDMVKFQFLLIREVERNTSLKCFTKADTDRVLKGGKMTITYGDAMENLKNNALKYSKNDYIRNSVIDLYSKIKNSDLKDFRFGVEPQKRFSDLEDELDYLIIRRELYMNTELVGIKAASELLELTESAIKQACQQERLLNTKKIGKTWVVHIPECRAYWNKPDTETKNSYYNLEY